MIELIPLADIIKEYITEMSEVGESGTSGVPGVNKSFQVKDSKGQKYVFKPSDGEHTSKWRYVPPHSQYKRERAAYVIDKELGFSIVPETKITTINGKIGSLQKWVDDTQKSDVSLASYETYVVWKVGLFDIIIGNIDRHCLVGNTKVKLLDGTYATLEQLSKRKEKYYVYGITQQGKIKASLATPAFVSGRNVPVYEVLLDDGEKIECTPEHKFMRRDGKYVSAVDLKRGDSLMPLYWKYNTGGNALHGYEMIIQPSDNKWHYTHSLIGGKKKRGLVRHHKDFHKLNNCPDNFSDITNKEHAWIHSERKIGKTNEEIFGEEKAAEIKEKKRIAGLGRKHSVETKILIGSYKRGKTLEQIYGADRAKEIKNKNSSMLRRFYKVNRVWNKGKRYEDYMDAEKIQTMKENRNEINSNLAKTRARDPNGKFLPINHKVVSVRYKCVVDKVYDISTETGNFALSAGVFVHNSGNWLGIDDSVIAIDHGYSFPTHSGEGDPRSVILSRFAVKVWGKQIPHAYMVSLQKLKNTSIQRHLEHLLEKEAVECYNKRVDQMLSTGIAEVSGYRVEKKVKGIPPKKD